MPWDKSTGVILSPTTTQNMLEKKHGRDRIKTYRKNNEAVLSQTDAYNQRAIQGDFRPIYHFGENVLEDKDLCIDDKRLHIVGFDKPVNLDIVSPYPDMKITDNIT